MSVLTQTVLAVAPWIIGMVVARWRARGSRDLAEESGVVPSAPPLVSVVVPARNEARGIEACLQSILGSTYPALEVIAVDDHSTDGTGDLARAIAARDPRLRVLDAPPLPAGWFGKSWACATAAGAARGDILFFTDADTFHAPELVVRLVNAQRRTGADLISVAGRQEVVTFWERVIQPVMLTLLSMRYGGTERVNRSRDVHDKIASGMCIFVRRDAYTEVGGHAAVRDKVAEDLMLAQKFFLAGKQGLLFLAMRHISVRMYHSLGEVIGGWRKNVFAGSRETLPSWLPQRLVPLLLVGPLLITLLPVIALVLAITGLWPISPIPPLAASLALLAFWIPIFRLFGVSGFYALTYPLGTAAVLYIIAGAIARGRRVVWKDREYTSA